jgi:hypothetical protein
MDKLLLPKVTRENVLLSLGYSTKDLADAVRSMVLCRNQRRQTVLTIGAQPFEEALQRVGRKVKRMVSTSVKHDSDCVNIAKSNARNL